jgi:ATP-dependent Zn protease
VRDIISRQYVVSSEILERQRALLDKATATLLETETIAGAELKAMAAELEHSGKTGSQAREAQTA